MAENKKGWVELTVTTTPAAGEMVGELLVEGGCGGVVYHDPHLYDQLEAEPAELLPASRLEGGSYQVVGYLPLEPGWEERVQRLQTGIEELRPYLPVGSGQVTVRQIPEENWAAAWKAYYRPVQVGPFFITPSWLSPALPVGAIELVLIRGWPLAPVLIPRPACLAL